jgi:hypothetical protein
MSASLAVVVLLAITAAGTAAASEADAALVELNTAFRAHYAEARRAVLARERTVLVIAFDRAVMFRNGRRIEEAFTPPIYDRVKTVAHVPLALYVLSARWDGDVLQPEAIDALKAYRAKTLSARAGLAGIGLSPASLARQYALVDAVLSEVDRTLSAGRYDGQAVAALCRSLLPAILDNVRDAARAQLDGLDAVTERWRAQIGEDDWRRAKVVVLGVRQARADNLQYSYFRRALGPNAENQRLFYAEGLFTEQLGLDLLGTILLDRGVSMAFFGNESRMERDLLGDAAATYLDEMFGKR